MAARLSRPGCLLLRCVGIKQNTNAMKCINSTNKATPQRVFYGTDRTEDNEGTTDSGEVLRVHVPVDRLTVSYSRSSGPGGQHVNKVSSRADVRFHVSSADWIPADVRQQILLKQRVTASGELLVSSQRSRSAHKNLQDCIQKISDIIAQASFKPRPPSEEAVARAAVRQQKKNEERLRQKMIQSKTKRSRRVERD